MCEDELELVVASANVVCCLHRVGHELVDVFPLHDQVLRNLRLQL